MGLFATTTGLETRFPGTPFTGMTSLASECCQEAEDEIRKLLANRYDISSAVFNTTTSIPPMCRTMATWYALGLLLQYNSRGSKESIARGQEWIKKAIDNCEQINDFAANLLASNGSAIAEDSDKNYIYSNTTDYVETFAEDADTSQAVDIDKLDDIDDDRD